MKIEYQLGRNLSVLAKKSHFNKAFQKLFFKICRLCNVDILSEVKFYFTSKPLSDDSDKFVGTVPKSIAADSVR